MFLKLNERKSVTANVYQGQVYFHIRDGRKQKSVSLTTDEFEQLNKKTSELMKNAKRLLKTTKNKQKEGKAKKGDKRKERDSSLSESDSDGEDSRMESAEESE